MQDMGIDENDISDVPTTGKKNKKQENNQAAKDNKAAPNAAGAKNNANAQNNEKKEVKGKILSDE